MKIRSAVSTCHVGGRNWLTFTSTVPRETEIYKLEENKILKGGEPSKNSQRETMADSGIAEDIDEIRAKVLIPLTYPPHV